VALIQAVAQDAVDFGDHLHVGIFDAVVDGLDEMASAVLAEPGNARIVVELRSDRGQHLFDALPGLFLAADHDRRAVTRTLLTTGNAHADKGQAAILEIVETAHRIAEIGVAGVDHDVVFLKIRLEQFHLLIDRLAGLDHDDDRPWRADRSDEFLDGLARHDLALQAACFGIELPCCLDGAVEDCDLVAFFGNVERQIRSHNTKTDKADFCLCHVCASVGQ
jgi:hypothetical protein